MKKPETSETRKAYITGKDGTRYEFDMPKDTAEKVLRLQKMILEERANRKKQKPE